MHTELWLGNLNVRNHLENLGVNGILSTVLHPEDGSTDPKHVGVSIKY
jgi:hypothetical protein